MFARTRRMPCWLSDQKNFRCKARNICSMFQSEEKLSIFLKKKLLTSKCSMDGWKTLLTTLTKDVWHKVENFLFNVGRNWTKISFSKKQTFPQTVPLDTYNTHLTDPAKNSMPCSKKDSKWEKWFFQKYLFLLKRSYRHVEMFWKICSKVSKKTPKSLRSISEKGWKN